MRRAGVIILDADGVLLDERPYWRIAMQTALSVGGASVADFDWTALCAVAFDALAMQRLCKRRGCNSNWDLAAVLAAGVDDALLRELRAPTPPDDLRPVLADWSRRVEDKWAGDQIAHGDPLAGFGIDRDGAFFRTVSGRFQRLLDDCDSEGVYDGSPCAVREPVAALRAVLRQLMEAGFDLRIYTGRTRPEIDTPLERLGFTEFFDREGIVAHEDIVAAQERLSCTGLGKPHWFGVVLAALGETVADTLQRGGDPPNCTDRRIYVGDAMADFLAVQGSCAVGVELDYVHVRSGATDAAQERYIAGRLRTTAVVDRLSEVPVRLGLVS